MRPPDAGPIRDIGHSNQSGRIRGILRMIAAVYLTGISAMRFRRRLLVLRPAVPKPYLTFPRGQRRETSIRPESSRLHRG